MILILMQALGYLFHTETKDLEEANSLLVLHTTLAQNTLPKKLMLKSQQTYDV